MEVNMSVIQFEGMVLQKDRIGRIWLDDSNVFCQYGDKQLLLKEFEDPDWAEFIFKNFILSQLG